MKTKWIIISITLFILLMGSLYYIFFYNKPTVIEMKEYSCSGVIKVDKTNFTLNSKQEFVVDDTGAIVENLTYVTYEYDSKETYEAAKKIYETLIDSNSTYKYDNTNHKIISIKKTTSATAKDADGNEVDVWYKDYIKSLEKQNYTCKKLNS